MSTGKAFIVQVSFKPSELKSVRHHHLYRNAVTLNGSNSLQLLTGSACTCVDQMFDLDENWETPPFSLPLYLCSRRVRTTRGFTVLWPTADWRCLARITSTQPQQQSRQISVSAACAAPTIRISATGTADHRFPCQRDQEPRHTAGDNPDL